MTTISVQTAHQTASPHCHLTTSDVSVTHENCDGRTVIDLRHLDLQPKDLQAPTRAEIDRMAFALADLRFSRSKP